MFVRCRSEKMFTIPINFNKGDNFMRKSVIALICISFIIMLFGCNTRLNEQRKNDIIFNQVSGYYSSGQRSVNPEIVTKEVFCSNYKIDTSFIPEDATYILNYRYDMETGTIDKTALVDGYISIYDKTHEKGFHICISEESFVPEYSFEVANVQLSTIKNNQVELYKLIPVKDYMKKMVYAKLEVEKYKISMSFNNLSESEIINTIQDLIEKNQ